jgi:hypothetical protein
MDGNFCFHHRNSQLRKGLFESVKFDRSLLALWVVVTNGPGKVGLIIGSNLRCSFASAVTYCHAERCLSQQRLNLYRGKTKVHTSGCNAPAGVLVNAPCLTDPERELSIGMTCSLRKKSSTGPVADAHCRVFFENPLNCRRRKEPNYAHNHQELCDIQSALAFFVFGHKGLRLSQIICQLLLSQTTTLPRRNNGSDTCLIFLRISRAHRSTPGTMIPKSDRPRWYYWSLWIGTDVARDLGVSASVICECFEKPISELQHLVVELL